MVAQLEGLLQAVVGLHNRPWVDQEERHIAVEVAPAEHRIAVEAVQEAVPNVVVVA